jgi:hypothetical protein
MIVGTRYVHVETGAAAWSRGASGGSYPSQIAALCGLKSPEPVACLTLTIERHPSGMADSR